MVALECTSSHTFFATPASIRGGKCFARPSTSKSYVKPEKFQLQLRHLPVIELLNSSSGAQSNRHSASGTGKGSTQPARCEVTTRKGNEAVMRQKLKAHTGPLTSVVVLEDGKQIQKIVTASLDKTVAFWSLHENGFNQDQMLCMRISPNDPVLSLAVDPERVKSGSNSVYCGMAHGKNIVCWEPPVGRFVPKVSLNGHTGWVRALVSEGRWLFSCDCNNLRLWDMSWAVPRNVGSISLFKGEILNIAVSGRKVFVGCDDGSIRSWTFCKSGILKEATIRTNAHDGRITGLLWHDNILYTTGRDGHLKSWKDDSLSLRSISRHAHNFQKINCMVLGPDNILYTGGDDNLIRRWSLKTLQMAQSPLFCHSMPVRVLAAGTTDTLVSGDAGGYVTLWKV